MTEPPASDNVARLDEDRVVPEAPPPRLERAEGGWLVRLALRREEVQVEKRTVVAERLLIRRRPVQDVERVQDTVRREEVRVNRDERGRLDDPDATQPLDRTTRLPHDTLAGSGMEQDPAR